MQPSYSVVMLGATGAVGGHVATTLSKIPQVDRLTLLGRRKVEGLVGQSITQHMVDVLAPSSYQEFLVGHQTAICALGVGQPSKVSKADFIKVDKEAVLNFAVACKQAGLEHFELLGAVGVNAKSSYFYSRIKGELEEALKALNFQRLSFFHPSMILTSTNRYGLSQQILLMTWPLISPLFIGSLRKYRGIRVDILGAAMAKNVMTDKQGVETLQWDEFAVLAKS